MTGDPGTTSWGGASVELRAATPADRPAVELLCVAALEYDVRRDARAFPEVLGRRPVTHLVAFAGGELVGTGYASISRRPVASSAADGEDPQDPQGTQDPDAAAPAQVVRGHIDLIAVAPGARGRGVGRRLLDALEESLLAQGAGTLLVTGNPPYYAWPGVDTRYTAGICLFESAGYARVGDAHNMTVELRGRGEALDTTADEERLAAEGISVRRLEAFDEKAITPWLTRWGGSWGEETLATLRFDPVRAHVALGREGQWLGFAAWGSNAPTVFGPMGTEESARRHGIGSVLLRRCLADQYVDEIDVAQIGWAGPHRFYSRAVDARISRTFWLMEKPTT